MSGGSDWDITRLLQQAGGGDRAASDAVMQLVHEELRAIAAQKLRGMPPSATLQPTALVSECYLRLIGKRVDYASRLHFFKLAGRIMRGIVVDYTRRHDARKRGGDVRRMPLDDALEAAPERTVGEMAAVSAAMDALAERNSEAHEVVLLKYFAGLSHEEVAKAKGIPLIRVRRLWKLGTTLLAELIDEDS